MADHPNSTHHLPKPKTAKGSPKKITTQNPPGGPATPGARAVSGKSIAELAAEAVAQRDIGTDRSK